MHSMINKDFDNLVQRGVYSFLATYPSFYPIDSSSASTEEQKAAYDFIKSIYEKLYDDPALLGIKLAGDDSYGDWELQNVKPKLAPAIRNITKKIDEFISTVWQVSMYGQAQGNVLTVKSPDAAIKPSFVKLLASFGVKANGNKEEQILTFPFNATGLKLLAQISERNVKHPDYGSQKPWLLFSRGVFDENAPWSAGIFGNMFADRSAFNRLIGFLEQNGYQRIDNKDYGNQISLDYIKCYGKPDDKLKWAWAERTHGGIEVIYEEIKKNQPLISMRIPYFIEVLKSSEKMNERIKAFVLRTTKKCDGCRYCVQTDKTGNRPLAHISIDSFSLCPIFAGFQYRWRSLDGATVDGMIEMLRFIDELFAGRRR